MPLPNYDLDTVEDKGGPVEVPEGEYSFMIDNAEERTSKEKKLVYTNLTLKLQVGSSQVTCYDSVFYTPKALFKLKQLVEATGMQEPKEPSDFIGHKGTAHIVKNKEGYPSVKWYCRAGSTPKPMEATAEVDPNTIPF